MAAHVAYAQRTGRRCVRRRVSPGSGRRAVLVGCVTQRQHTNATRARLPCGTGRNVVANEGFTPAAAGPRRTPATRDECRGLSAYIRRFHSLSSKQTDPIQLLFSATDSEVVPQDCVDELWQPAFAGPRYLGSPPRAGARRRATAERQTVVRRACSAWTPGEAETRTTRREGEDRACKPTVTIQGHRPILVASGVPSFRPCSSRRSSSCVPSSHGPRDAPQYAWVFCDLCRIIKPYSGAVRADVEPTEFEARIAGGRDRERAILLSRECKMKNRKALERASMLEQLIPGGDALVCGRASVRVGGFKGPRSLPLILAVLNTKHFRGALDIASTYLALLAENWDEGAGRGQGRIRRSHDGRLSCGRPWPSHLARTDTQAGKAGAHSHLPAGQPTVSATSSSCIPTTCCSGCATRAN